MMFSLFAPLVAKHLRKSREYLEDAKLKRVEHEAAAERHRAISELYAERISRIESDISAALQAASGNHPHVLGAKRDSVPEKSDPAPACSSRASRA